MTIGASYIFIEMGCTTRSFLLAIWYLTTSLLLENDPSLFKTLLLRRLSTPASKVELVMKTRLFLFMTILFRFVIQPVYAMTVHEDKSMNNVVDTIKIVSNPNEEDNRLNFIVATRDGENFSLSVVEHPLSTIHPAITKREYIPYVGMTSIVCKNMKFVAIIFGSNLTLFEVSDELLQERSNLDLGKVPFQITSFNSKFIVAFTEEFQLFELDFVSHSDIRLKKLTTMLTQGSTSYISNDDEFVAVCDELQSLVLYAYEDDALNKFSEHARNCMDFGLSICKVSGEDFFCADHNGNFFQMQISESKNIESSDLDILSCCALGEAVSAMLVFGSPKKESEDNQTKVLIGTKSSQYIEVINFRPTDEFLALYFEIEKSVQSLGRLTSRSNRTVLIENFMLPCPVMFNFDLIKFFLELDEEQQLAIAEEAKLPIELVMEIAESIMRLV